MEKSNIDSITFKSSIEHPDSDLMIQYQKETGKRSVWGGKQTKQFLKWKELNVYQKKK